MKPTLGPSRALALAGLLAAASLASPSARAGAEPRPLLVTVDDLPIAASGLHPDPGERRRITEGLLAALARHRIRAVGLVICGSIQGEGDLELLRMWLDAGHELGNHSTEHRSYTDTDPVTYRDDVESCRLRLGELLAPRGARVRFFRFPMLREGDTRDKLVAMRDYLAASGQRNLPPTIDNQDWSFERPWVEARRAGDTERLARIGDDYLAALRIMVRHHERTGDRLFGRRTPQILLLHANEVGAAEWDELFDWLEAEGHRFVDVDTILGDPSLQATHNYVAPLGPGFWDRLLFERRVAEAQGAIESVLAEQVRAWNRGDVEAFAAAYAEDALMLSSSGLTRGREAIVERYRRRYPGPGGMGRLSLEVLEWNPAAGVEVSLLGDARPGRVHGMSLVARWRLAYPDREALSGLTLLTLRPRDGVWEIVHDASM